MSGIDFSYLIANVTLNLGMGIFLSVFLGRKFRFSPPWLGYSLGFVAGLFVGGGIWQLVKIIFVFTQALSTSTLGYESDLLFLFVFNSIVYTVVLLGMAAVIVAILWKRKV